MRAMNRISFKRLSRLWKSRAGGVLIYFAIAAPVLIGLAGASIDIGLWYANKRIVQSAVDSAALAGALEVLRSGGDMNAVVAAITLDAAVNGFSTGNGDTITVDTSNNPKIDVTIVRPTPGLLSQVVFTEQTNVAARAVAEADVIDSCVWSLNPNASGAVSVSGSAQVNLGCGVVVNSNDGGGLSENGNGCLNASKIKVVGGASGNCLNPTPITGVPPVADPLAALPAPSVGSCDYNNVQINNGDATLNPGVYCTKLKINTNGTVTFNPGLYILDSASFSISAQSTVVGSDVSFFLTNADVNDDISINGGASVTLSAPSNGALAGILFYGDRNNPSTITHKFNGGSNLNFSGVLYFPNTEVQFTGGNSLQSSAVIIIADKVSFSGNADVFIGGFGNSPVLGNPLLIQARLVE